MQLRNRNRVVYSVLFTLAAAAFSSCLKSVENQPPKKQTYISILHLAPAAPPVDIYLNSTKSTAAPIPPGTFFTRYSALDPDVYSVEFKKGGGDSLVASIPADVYDSLQYATLLLYNDPVGSGVKAERIDDEFSNISTSMSNYRFFHVAPGLMPVDVYFDDTRVYTDRRYVDNVQNQYNNLFQTRDPGIYTVYVKKAGSDSLIVSTTASIQQAQAYTILLTGIPGATGDNALALDLLQASN